MELLTTKKVAERFSVSPRTVANWLKRGLPHFKLGRTVRVSPEDIELWIKKNKRVELLPLTPALAEALRGGLPMVEFSVPKCRKPKGTRSFL
jgi:excisionase family DNA binding protein